MKFQLLKFINLYSLYFLHTACPSASCNTIPFFWLQYYFLYKIIFIIISQHVVKQFIYYHYHNSEFWMNRNEGSCRILKGLPMIPILSPTNPTFIVTYTSLRFNLILLSHLCVSLLSCLTCRLTCSYFERTRTFSYSDYIRNSFFSI